jgi:hypothetical protein
MGNGKLQGELADIGSLGTTERGGFSAFRFELL